MGLSTLDETVTKKYTRDRLVVWLFIGVDSMFFDISNITEERQTEIKRSLYWFCTDPVTNAYGLREEIREENKRIHSKSTHKQQKKSFSVPPIFTTDAILSLNATTYHEIEAILWAYQFVGTIYRNDMCHGYWLWKFWYFVWNDRKPNHKFLIPIFDAFLIL